MSDSPREGAPHPEAGTTIRVGDDGSAAKQDPEQQVLSPDTPPTLFEIELDFVQSLANPNYLNFLAQNNYFDDEQFIAYLEYLEYWRRPEYIKYLIYPNCLHVLTLLKQPRFRQEIRHEGMAQTLQHDILSKWLGVGKYEPEESSSADSSEAKQQQQDGDEVMADAPAQNEAGQLQQSEIDHPNGSIKPDPL
ncbi:SOH1-domain-containing protein [Limtongia smithiae]|uniref:SOH1-domain-containing protein n=1 Tax=Limtongia smithiae TaxID=1125753 RepID=UPI0034CFAB87